MENLVIIGGGPAGLAAGIYASRAMLNPVIIEGQLPGGQLTQTTDVENYPGFPKGIQGGELVSNMREQAARFETRFITENVTEISTIENGFKLKLTNNNEVTAKSILVATGADANWLGIDSETRLKGRGVSGCATCDGFFFQNKVVAVIGGGDSAMEEATYLTRFATEVIIIHRRDEFRASKIMQKRVLNNPKISVMWNKEVVEVLGGQAVTGVKVRDTTTEELTDVNVDGVFLAIGHTPSTSFLNSIDVMLDEKGYIYTTDRVMFEQLKDIADTFDPRFRYATSVPGIFAAGDCTDATYKQAGTAVGMAIAAEIEIEHYLESIE